MTSLRCGPALAAFLLWAIPHNASAAILLFDFAASDPRNSVTFTLDSTAVPSATSTNWTQFSNVAATRQGVSFSDTVKFGTSRWGGGFSFLSSPALDFFGMTLFTGPVAQPQFTIGSFALRSNVDGKPAGTLLISHKPAPPPPSAPIASSPPVTAPVPEPGTWALLVVGFAMVGAWLRGGSPATRRTVAAGWRMDQIA